MPESNLALFQFESQDIRFVDGKPVANDVAMALGYSDPAKTVSTKVNPKNKSLTNLVTVDGKLRSVMVLEESGIYQLIFGSKLPSAEKFQDWVFDEVLPSIRKMGQYKTVDQPDFHLPTTYIDALKALVAAEEQKALLEAERALLEQTNAALSEAVDELFNYSSIIRVAKFNNVKEAVFSWHRLKAATKQLGLEVKKVPSARYEYQLLYPHDAWRLAYPGVALPETTTLVINTKAI